MVKTVTDREIIASLFGGLFDALDIKVADGSISEATSAELVGLWQTKAMTWLMDREHSGAQWDNLDSSTHYIRSFAEGKVDEFGDAIASKNQGYAE